MFSAGTDAVTAGLNWPSSNAIGISFMVTDLSAKRMELLFELRPLAARLGLLVNPSYPVPTETRLTENGVLPRNYEYGSPIHGAAQPRGGRGFRLTHLFSEAILTPAGGFLIETN